MTQERLLGVDPAELDDNTLVRHLASLHRTRLDVLRYGRDRALVTHLARTGELEVEYLRRYPGRQWRERWH